MAWSSHGFPGPFSDTTEHIRLLLFSFLFCFPLFSCWFSAVDTGTSAVTGVNAPLPPEAKKILKV